MELVQKIDHYNNATYIEFKGNIVSVTRNAGYTKKDSDGNPTDDSKAFAIIAVACTANGVTQTIDALAYENSLLVLPHAYEVGKPMDVHLYTGLTPENTEHSSVKRGFTRAQLPGRPSFEDILSGFGFGEIAKAKATAGNLTA